MQMDARLPRIGDKLQVEIDVADEGSEKLVWAAATVSNVDAGTGEFQVMVTEFENLAPDDDDYEEAYEEGPYVAANENRYAEGYEGRWRRVPSSVPLPSNLAAAPAAKPASVRVTTRRAGVAIKTSVKVVDQSVKVKDPSVVVRKNSKLPKVGDKLQVEIDVADEGSEKLVWAAATVSNVDAGTGEFQVMVTEFENLAPDDDDYEEAYEEGPYVAANENRYAEGYEGRWRRVPMASVKPLPAIGEKLVVEIDVADEGSEQLMWAAATVSSVDSSTGEFQVMVTEFENLAPDDDDYEAAYEEGPYCAANENRYAKGYEGRWRRAPRVSEEAGWRKWLAKPVAGVDGWWRQDDKVVTLTIQLPEGSTFKRDVRFKLSADALSLTVMRGGSDEVASLTGQLSHTVDADESDWFVEDTGGAGFEGFGPDARFLVVMLQKASRGVTWSSVVLRDGEVPEAMVTVKRTDGVTVRRPDAPSSKSQPDGKPLAEAKKTISELLDVKGTNVTAQESASKGVGVTIRRKKK